MRIYIVMEWDDGEAQPIAAFTNRNRALARQAHEEAEADDDVDVWIDDD